MNAITNKPRAGQTPGGGRGAPKLMLDSAEAVAFQHGPAALYLDLQRQAIAAGDDFEAVMRLVAGYALRLLPNAAGATILLREGDQLAHRAGSGEAEGLEGLRLPIEGSFAGRAVTTGKPVMCLDSEKDARVNRDLYRAVGLRSVMVIPLTVDDETMGVLKVHSAQPDAFDRDQLLLAELLAGPLMIGLAAQTRREHRLTHDRLDRRYRATFDHAAVGVAHVALDGRFLAVNDRFCEIVGHGRDTLLTGAFQQITHPDDVAQDMAHVRALAGGAVENYAMEKRYLREDGGIQWVRLTVSLVRDAAGAPDFFVSIIEDIAAQKAAEEAVLTDALTGLPNRRWLVKTLPELLGAAEASGTGFGVAFLDLDGFKAVNDRFGHDVGDTCLVEAALALRATLGEAGSVVRLAGDEFVLLFPATDETRLRGDAWRVQAALAALGESRDWPIDASIGSVFVTSGAGVPAEDVLRLADGMMYSAKRAGGSRHVLTVLG